MKKAILFAALMALLAALAFGQDAAKPNFSGSWALDIAKSNLPQMMQNIESMTMTVAQTDKDISVETAIKNKFHANSEMPQGGRGGQGGPGGPFTRGGGGNSGKSVYTLDGKETTVEIEGVRGAMPVTLKGKFDKEKLKLSQSRTFAGPVGEMTITTKETWSLSADGKTLTVKRDSETPRGAISAEMVFNKAETIEKDAVAPAPSNKGQKPQL
jgi:hypothetical protein